MPRQDTIFERYLAPVFKLFVDREAIDSLDKSIDWESVCDRLTNPNLVYPQYYQTQNFHGIEGGYLNKSAALTYDPITQYAIPPNETWVRQEAIDAITVKPTRILDLGCGTGSTTLLLKQTFQSAEVIGLDLSPYMLAVAETKAKQAGLDIKFYHGLAEETGCFEPQSFDLVTASLLFHETPPEIAIAIAREAFRLLKAGGEVMILDGHQKVLRQNPWLTEIFEEPYLKDYATGSVDATLGAAGFVKVRSQDIWWINQVTVGLKPIVNQSTHINSPWEQQPNNSPFPAPA